MNPKLTSIQRRSVEISTAVFVVLITLILIFVRGAKERLGSRLQHGILNPDQRTMVAFEPATVSEIPQLMDALENWDMDVRYLAAFKLGRLGAPAVGPLLPKLNDAEPQVRRWTAVTLGMIGLPATNALAPLTMLLRDEHNDVRVAAAYALAQMGPGAAEAVPEIIEAVKRGTLPVPIGASFFPGDKKVPGGHVCTVVIGGYRWFGSSRQTAPRRAEESLGLMPNWKGFMQFEVELNAQGIHEVLGESAVPALIELIASPDDNVRNYAANTLAKVGKPAVKPLAGALRDARNMVRETAALALGMIGADAQAATPELVAMLESEKPTEYGHCRGCAAVAFALHHMGTNSVPTLLVLLNSDNPTASLYAAAALGEIRPKGQDELTRLISAFKDSRKHVRASAALVLGELGPAAQPAVPALEAAVMGNEPFDMIVAASTLEQIEPGGDGGTTVLARLLKHEKPDIRLGAAGELEGLGAKATNACAALVQALSDPDPGVRLGAISALGAIGLASEEVVDSLIGALKGTPPNRNQAALVLGRLGKPAMPNLLRSLKDQDPDVRRWAAFALAQVRDGKEAVPGLVVALADEIGFVRFEAAQAIGRIGQTWPNANGERQKSPAADAVPALVRCLKDADPNIRGAAADALGNIGQSGDAIAAPLRALISDESAEVRRAAVFSLESLGLFPKEAASVLEETANDPKAAEWIRSRAARLLQKIKSEGAE